MARKASTLPAAAIRRIEVLRDGAAAQYGSDAIAGVVEHAVRLVGTREKLTTRFAEIADLIREAAYYARHEGRDVTTPDDVSQAINERGGTEPDRTVTIGSPEFMKLLTQLTAQNRQSRLVPGNADGPGAAVLRKEKKRLEAEQRRRRALPSVCRIGPRTGPGAASGSRLANGAGGRGGAGAAGAQ